MKKLIAIIISIYLLISFTLSLLVTCGFDLIRLYRAPFLVVELVQSMATDDDGNGVDTHGNYISLRGIDGIQPGDEVLTLFVWNPATNWCDDISARFDIAVYRP